MSQYHTKKKSESTFCSRSCAGKYNNRKRYESGWRLSEESKAKTSKALTGRKLAFKRQKSTIKRKKKYKKLRLEYCEICYRAFFRKSYSKTKTCSKKCSNTAAMLTKEKRNRRIGFHRNTYKYYNKWQNKNVVLQSSWEVKIAELLDSEGIAWVRPKSIPWVDSEGIEHRYYPDFYLPEHDLYLDPKNEYCMKQDEEKMTAVAKKIEVWYGDVSRLKEQILTLV